MPNQDVLLENINKVSDAMKSMKNTSINEQFPIGLIDIHLWEWPQGVGLYGLLQLYEATKDAEVLRFLESWYDARLTEGLPEKNVNTCAPMLTLISLCELTGNEKYERVCEEWSSWIMEELLRTGDGAFQHMITGDANDGQILIDTLFMTVLFLAKAGVYFKKPAYVEEAKRQFLVHIKYLYNKQTGLFYHGWDFNENHNYGAVHWGRGNAWYTAGVMDFLNIIPIEDGLKAYLLDTATAQVRALGKLQHEDGMWHTVLDDPDSYKETSATAAFGYGILKGIRYGYLDESYRNIGIKALEAVLRHIDHNGVVQQVSYGTPVGNDAQFYKEIPISPMGYGQALTLFILIEALRIPEA
ncbi:glycoside hydrolase family 88 protein [Paenibacillus barcinonensis]|jgi:unsaturated rhamnogalacturonyl hydrolase|uniref:beta-galactosidase BglB n=1 Tax=Paenibacillus TaxID=44249 RepID=UPI001C106690|nr:MULTISPECIES: glycoside hydrolase family 88 protein [Paenibacillus]MBU5351157.1 glycoside hydrolase family 88 protein [Paenibacillus barcinonensis]MDM5278214.1 glycoside hydrolase family 88 protein [Paenibacillus silvae]